jgi:2-polyprenyl-3-methyl-5-hydroxy-6-metoxy-1,4-benzoquinol methylase
MKLPEPQTTWPQTWKESHEYDRQEVYGPVTWLGYAYAYQRRKAETLKLIEEAVPQGGRILDVAAAQGNFTLALAELGYRMVWNDLRADLADYVKLKYEVGQVDYQPGNVFDLGYKGEFDAVLITEIIEHVAHPDEFLTKIGEMVKPGGYVIMTTPNGAHFMNRLPKFEECKNPDQYESVQFQPNGDGHIFLLWPEEVLALGNRAGLKMEYHSFFTTPWANGRHKTEILLRLFPERWILGLEKAAERLPQKLKAKLMIHSATRFKRN